MKKIGALLIVALAPWAAACAHRGNTESTAKSGDMHADHAMTPATGGAAQQNAALPAEAAGALARLKASPRHGEYQMIHTSNGDSVRAWIVYPERSTKAPVVVVVHEIFGLSNWVRGV